MLAPKSVPHVSSERVCLPGACLEHQASPASKSMFPPSIPMLYSQTSLPRPLPKGMDPGDKHPPAHVPMVQTVSPPLARAGYPQVLGFRWYNQNRH